MILFLLVIWKCFFVPLCVLFFGMVVVFFVVVDLWLWVCLGVLVGLGGLVGSWVVLVLGFGGCWGFGGVLVCGFGGCGVVGGFVCGCVVMVFFGFGVGFFFGWFEYYDHVVIVLFGCVFDEVELGDVFSELLE